MAKTLDYQITLYPAHRDGAFVVTQFQMLANYPEKRIEAAGMEQSTGEDMAALVVAGQLDFVDREKRHRTVERHGFHGADEIARPGRHALFLAGNQRHLVDPGPGRHPVVNFPRQQAERQTDHAALVTEHAFDGEVGLTGIGGPEDRRHARCMIGVRSQGRTGHGLERLQRIRHHLTASP